MTEEAIPQTPAPVTPDTGEQGPEADEKTDWKWSSRKHEEAEKKLRRENESLAKRIQEREDADKSAEQKAADKAVESEKRATAAELKVLQYEVAADKGVPRKLQRYLTGATKEELEANADELLASFAHEPAEEKGDTLPGRPKEALKSGSTSADTDKLSDDPQQRARDYYANAKAK